MERGRKTKVITVVALLVAIVTMSLGFAVFSNVLTISSSATVKPNAEDYVINIYGAAEEIPEDVLSYGEVSEIISYLTSRTTGVPTLVGAFDATSAIIDNRNFTITNLNVTVAGINQGANYVFMIKNEGKNSVFLNLENLIPEGYGTCIAEEGTTQSLVDQDCNKIIYFLSLMTSTGEYISTGTSAYEIVPNDAIGLLVSIGTTNGNEIVADGEFTVNFNDLELEFSSVDNSQSN